MTSYKDRTLLVVGKSSLRQILTKTFIMKTVIKLLIVFLVIGVVSCRDTKKEETETKTAVEQIEAIETEAEAISKEIEKEVEELENDLKELDNI